MKPDHRHEHPAHASETEDTAEIDPLLLCAVRQGWDELVELRLPPPCPVGNGQLHLNRRCAGPWIERRPEMVDPEAFLPLSEFVSAGLSTGTLARQFPRPARRRRPASGLLSQRLAHLTAKRRATEVQKPPRFSKKRLARLLALLRERRSRQDQHSS